MRIIVPDQPTNDTLTSSIPESSVALWNKETNYTEGQEVRHWVDGAYRLFLCLIDNKDADPSMAQVNEDGAALWLPLGPTNKWAMFGGSVSEPTTQGNGQPLIITYNTTSKARINSLALFGLTASEVTVTATSLLGGGEVYSETKSGTSNRGPLWWRYLFSPVRQIQRLQFDGMPAYPDLIITVTVQPRGNVAAVGEAVFGRQYIIGEDEIGMQPSIKDYSVNRFDDNFGYNVLVKRQTRRRLNISVAIPSERADDVFATMESLASVRVVWIADKYESGSIYGFYTDFTPTHSTHPLVYANIKIEGLI